MAEEERRRRKKRYGLGRGFGSDDEDPDNEDDSWKDEGFGIVAQSSGKKDLNEVVRQYAERR